MGRESLNIDERVMQYGDRWDYDIRDRRTHFNIGDGDVAVLPDVR